MMYWLALVLLSWIVCISASDVLVLTKDNFTEVEKHDTILVEFYAPWCGHCKALAPHYEKAATSLRESHPEIKLAKVDAEAERELKKNHSVTSYPTLILFKFGKFKELYEGERDQESIQEYVVRRAKNATVEITSEEELSEFLDENYDKASVIGFFPVPKVAQQDILEGVADKMSGKFAFAYTHNTDLINKYKYENDIVLIRAKMFDNEFEPSRMKYPGTVYFGKLTRWIEKNAHGICGVINTKNVQEFDQRPLVLIYSDVDFVKNAEYSHELRKRVLKVASEILNVKTSTAIFALANDKDLGDLKQYGIEKIDPLEVRVVARGVNQEKYVMEQKFSEATFRDWLISFLDGKEKVFIRSQELPTSDEGPVKVVVAKNFDAVVNDKEKDVFLEFYAPWCGHCQKLAPTYEKLATLMKNEPRLVVAKMDAVSNDIPSPYKVEGYPTIYYVPRRRKHAPFEYKGEKDLDEFIRFLAERSTDGLEGYDVDGEPIDDRSDL